MNKSDPCAADVVRSAIAHVAPDRADDLDGLDRSVDVWREFDLDSLDHVIVMELIADATGCDIAERDYPRLLSFGQLCAHVERVLH
jgi:acyl carrier protein